MTATWPMYVVPRARIDFTITVPFGNLRLAPRGSLA